AKISTVFSEETDTRTDFHTVRLGLNYKLGASADSYETSASAAGYEKVRNWGGLYVGAQSGWMWSDIGVDFPLGSNPALQVMGVPGKGYSVNNNTGIFGGQVGLQHQFGSHLVLGVEGTAWTTMFSKDKDRLELCIRQVVAQFNCEVHI